MKKKPKNELGNDMNVPTTIGSWEERFEHEFVKEGKNLKKNLELFGHTSCPICGTDPDTQIPYIKSFIEKVEQEAYERGRREVIEEIKIKLPWREFDNEDMQLGWNKSGKLVFELLDHLKKHKEGK